MNFSKNIRPAVFLVKNNRVLTLRYEYNGNEVLALPGGNLEFNESMADCLKRELLEELSIKVKIGKMITCGEINHLGKSTLHVIYEGLSYKNDPKINSNETSALSFEWVDLNSISQRLFYPNVLSELKNWYLYREIQKYLGKINQKFY